MTPMNWETPPVVVTCSNGHSLSKIVKFSVFTENRVPFFQYLTPLLEQPKLRFSNWNGKQIHEASERIFTHQIRCPICRKERWFADADLADLYDDTLYPAHTKSIDLQVLASKLGHRRD